jgi:hypothetical protein
MRFDARHIGSGVWGVWDGGVMSWRGTDFAENEAKQRAADMNVMFDQYGERSQQDRREVQPAIAVESATWSAVGDLDYWIKERHDWWGRVRGPDGHPVWIRAADLRPVRGTEEP